MQIIDGPSTRAALPFDRLVPALEALFIQGCQVPPRHVHEVAGPDGSLLTCLIMPAWSSGGHFGIKTVNIAAGNAARGLPGLHSVYVLFDATTGVPLAQMDGDEITARRTVATSALAASKLVRAEARHLVVVGAGRVARLLAPAYRAVLPIDKVTVWARVGERAQALADELREGGIDAAATSDLAAAVASADVVSCATLATEPVVQGRWLAPHTHLDLIGSFTPRMREADDDCFAGADIYVDTEEALDKSGDLLGPLSRGVFRRQDLGGTLADLCRGTAPARRSLERRSVFKSVGFALEDLAAAMLVAG